MYLPIGSVVILEGGNKTLMIYGFKQKNLSTNEKFDYVSCFYPEGNLLPSSAIMFNHTDIAQVIFEGYVDDSFTSFIEKIKELG